MLVGLVMLLLLTMMAVAALKFGTSNFMVVANQQTRNEAVGSAEQVIDQIIENTEIQLVNGSNLFGTGSNTVAIDMNGDTISDYSVAVLPPTCVKRRVIPQADLNFAVSDDLGCSRSVDQSSLGVEGAGSSDSLCSEVVWDVSATAQDAFLQNSVTLRQGVGQRVATTRVTLVCP